MSVYIVVKKQDSRSMSLVERNQFTSEVVLIQSYLLLPKGDLVYMAGFMLEIMLPGILLNVKNH